MATMLLIGYLVFTVFTLSQAHKAYVFEIASAVYLFIATFIVGMSWPFGLFMWFLIAMIVAITHVESLRAFIANKLYARARHALPKLSKTEEEALNAGDTWLEQDIFTGTPDWQRLHAVNTMLTEEEQSFLNHETQTLCSMIDEWKISQERDLPPSVWTYMKEQGFMGLVIDKAYGGKGFSARAHSDIVMKIASRSGVAAVTVMVPNSLGPGELLQHYGSDEQKSYYLPRLAKGIDIPCFALTEPGAGSDATSIQSEATVVLKQIDGQEVLGLRMSLDKRWITLAPVATLIGVAVNVKDPDGLLKGVGSEGITCLLMGRDTEHLEIGNRHLPANQPFMNGTIRGEDLFVPITSIIGGQKNAGKGWQMLVECLSIGRSISLPALSAASSSVAYVATSAFCRIRRQFNVEIGQFEGVQEKLAEIGGLNYIINAQRLLTLAAVYEHKKPSVASAITKYFNTEFGRMAVNDAMDIHGGRTVVVGPRNYLTNMYQAVPIAVTVEGANIMSRNLLIFGQGSMACHPYIRKEFYAISNEDKVAFSELIWQHITYFVRNMAKAVASAWTAGLMITAPNNSLHRDYQKLTRLSQAFAWIADLSLITLGGNLKRCERLSARLADGLSYLYMAMAVLRQAETDINNEAELVHARWALQYCFYHTQQALIAMCDNFPSKLLGWGMRLMVFPLGQSMRYPSDKLGAQLAKLMMTNNPYRERLKDNIYHSGNPKEALDKVEQTLQLIIKNDALLARVKDLSRCPFVDLADKLAEKVASAVITEEERQTILEIERARWDAILVDEFNFDDMKNNKFDSLTDTLATPFDKKPSP